MVGEAEDVDDAVIIAKLHELHPRPRIGQRVKLRKTGKIGEVIAVRRARDILRFKSEVDAMIMGNRLTAAFGTHWIEVYYEADIVIGNAMTTVNTMEVEEVLEAA